MWGELNTAEQHSVCTARGVEPSTSSSTTTKESKPTTPSMIIKTEGSGFGCMQGHKRTANSMSVLDPQLVLQSPLLYQLLLTHFGIRCIERVFCIHEAGMFTSFLNLCDGMQGECGLPAGLWPKNLHYAAFGVASTQCPVQGEAA